MQLYPRTLQAETNCTYSLFLTPFSYEKSLPLNTHKPSMSIFSPRCTQTTIHQQFLCLWDIATDHT